MTCGLRVDWTWEGKDPDDVVEINVLSVGVNFVETMEIGTNPTWLIDSFRGNAAVGSKPRQAKLPNKIFPSRLIQSVILAWLANRQ